MSYLFVSSPEYCFILFNNIIRGLCIISIFFRLVGFGEGGGVEVLLLTTNALVIVRLKSLPQRFVVAIMNWLIPTRCLSNFDVTFELLLLL